MRQMFVRWMNRNHRRTKTFLLRHRPPVTTHEEMARGKGLSLKDWSPEDGGGIHLVLQKTAAQAASGVSS